MTSQLLVYPCVHAFSVWETPFWGAPFGQRLQRTICGHPQFEATPTGVHVDTFVRTDRRKITMNAAEK